MSSSTERKKDPVAYLRGLLPNAVLVDPVSYGCLQTVAVGQDWCVMFDTGRQVMLLSHRHVVTEWTNMPRLNLHVRVMILLPLSNEAFLKRAKIQNVDACRPAWT